jgi:hypothetical protein
MTTIDHDAALMKDRALLAALVRALDASDVTLRREQCRGELGEYVVAGKSGHVCPDGDGFLLVVTTDASPRRWTNVKAKLGFCRVTIDGDDEGTLHLDHMPTPDQADLIREALGIRKRRNLSPETIERATMALGLARSRVKPTSGAPGCGEAAVP